MGTKEFNSLHIQAEFRNGEIILIIFNTILGSVSFKNYERLVWLYVNLINGYGSYNYSFFNKKAQKYFFHFFC